MNPYLKTKVLTASPEELRLMLFDGAIKFSRQAADAVDHKDWEKMHDALVRAQKIVIELSTSLNHEIDPDLCDKLAGLYNYIYRRLVDGNVERDRSAINESIELLGYERETWLMVINRSQKEQETSYQPATEPGNPVGKIGPGNNSTNADDTPRAPGISVQG